MKQLAIVIPAYKIDFFKETLDSLANQTSKDFTVYIGDDNSPDNFQDLVSEYVGKLDILYHRFNENRGGENLVAHWERCISLTQGEPWIWLFSDDDTMDERCVEMFLNEIDFQHNSCDQFDLYHFNVKIVDQRNVVLREVRAFPEVIGSELLYRSKSKAKIESFVVEYIFSRKIYELTGGFVNYDMAWGSDLATWVKMGMRKGIKTIPRAHVCWRQSERNITPDLNNKIVYKKAMIDVDFYKWINEFFNKKSIHRFNKYVLLRDIGYYSNILSFQQSRQILKYARQNGIVGVCFISIIYAFFPVFRIYKKAKI